MPPNKKNVAGYVFDQLQGQSHGVIVGIELNNEDALEIQIVTLEDGSPVPKYEASSLFGYLNNNAVQGKGSKTVESTKIKTLKNIRDMITKINNGSSA